MSVIAIDIGTSFLKGAVVDLDACELRHVTREEFPKPRAGLPSLLSEYDADEVVEVVSALISKLIGAEPKPEALVLCTQMHGLVLTTSAGEPRSPFYAWRDQRVLSPHPVGSGSYLDELAQRLDGIDLARLGTNLRPGYPLSFLFWLAERGELGGHREGTVPASLPAFVLSRLSGTEPILHDTCAAAHALYDLSEKDWYGDLIDSLDFGGLRWPRVTSQIEKVADIEIDGVTLPAIVGVGDHQCALAGSLLTRDDVSVNVSTGSQVSTLTDGLELGECLTRPFFDGDLLNTQVHIPSGRALDLLMSLFTEVPRGLGVEVEGAWDYVARAVSERSSDTVDPRVDLSFFQCVTGDRGELADLHESNLDVGSIFRGAFRGMAANYRHYAQTLTANPSWKRIVFSGGIAQRFGGLRELVEAEFGLPSRVSPSSEDTLVGLLVIGRVATRRSASVAEAMEFVRGRPVGLVG